MMAEMASTTDQRRMAQLKEQIARIEKQIAIERQRAAKEAKESKVLKATAKAEKLKRIREAQLQLQRRS